MEIEREMLDCINCPALICISHAFILLSIWKENIKVGALSVSLFLSI